MDITAFKYINDPNFYDLFSGNKIEKFEGHVRIFFADGIPTIFHTAINQYGERYYSATGNNPKI